MIIARTNEGQRDQIKQNRPVFACFDPSMVPRLENRIGRFEHDYFGILKNTRCAMDE